MKKFGYCMLALVPLIVSVCLQIASSALLFFYHAFRILLTGSPAGTLGLRDLFLSILESIGSRTYSTEVSLCFAMLGILVFGFWYRRLCHSGTDDVFFSCFSIHHVAALVLLVPGLQIVSSMVTAVTSSMFPSAMDYYENLMQSSGLTDSPSAALILYAVFLGPIGDLPWRYTLFCPKRTSVLGGKHLTGSAVWYLPSECHSGHLCFFYWIVSGLCLPHRSVHLSVHAFTYAV